MIKKIRNKAYDYDDFNTIEYFCVQSQSIETWADNYSYERLKNDVLSFNKNNSFIINILNSKKIMKDKLVRLIINIPVKVNTKTTFQISKTVSVNFNKNDSWPLYQTPFSKTAFTQSDNICVCEPNGENFVICSFDVTHFIKEMKEVDGCDTITLKIINDANQKFDAILPSLTSTNNGIKEFIKEFEYTYGELLDKSGLNTNMKHHVTQSNAGVTYTNLFTGNLIHKVDILSTFNKQMPIVMNGYYNFENKDSISILGKGFRSSFDYSVEINDAYYMNTLGEIEIIITDPTSKKTRYLFANKDKAFSEYKIDAKNKLGDLFINYEDLSYLTYERYDSTTYITLYEKSGYIFQLMHTNTYTRLYGLRTIDDHYIGFLPNSSGSLNSKIYGEYIDEERESEREEIDIEYENNLMKKIKSAGMKKSIQLIYNSNNYLTNIQMWSKDSSDADVKINEIVLEYDSDERLKKIQDILSKYQCLFTYDATSKVITMEESSNNEISNRVNINYMDKKTTLTLFDGSKNYYFFDKYGRLITFYDNKKNAASYHYQEIKKDGDVIKSNITNIQALTHENHQVLINDLTHELTDYNTKENKWGTINKYNTTISSDTGETRNVIFDCTENATMILRRPLFLKAGKYTLSGNMLYKLEVMPPQTKNMIMIRVMQNRPNPNYENGVEEISLGQFSIDSTKDIDKEKKYINFTMPNIVIDDLSEYNNIPITIEIIINVGTRDKVKFYLNGFKLEKEVHYNYIGNGDFQSALTNFWSSKGFDGNDCICTISDEVINFNKALKIQGQANIRKELYQMLQMQGETNDEIQVSAYIKGYITHNDVSCIYLKITYANEVKTYELSVDKHIENWQVLNKSIIAEKNYTKAEVIFVHQATKEVLIGNLKIHKGTSGSFYEYDDRNRIKKIVGMKEIKEFEYNEKDQVTKITTKDKTNQFIDEIVYVYGEYQKLIEENHKTKDNDFKIQYEYDIRGNNTKKIITTGADNKIVQEILFDDFSRAIIIKDEMNSNTFVSYSYLTNTLTQFRYPNGANDDFKYDAHDRITKREMKKSGERAEVVYDYDTFGRTKKISNDNGTLYEIGYNNVNDITKVLLNNIEIMKYDYGLWKNGINTNLVTKKTYGNAANADITFLDYDDEYRLKKVKLGDDADIAEYKYDSLGNIQEIYSGEFCRIKKMTYDEDGNITRYSMDNDTIFTYKAEENKFEAEYHLHKYGVTKNFTYDYNLKKNKKNFEKFCNILDSYNLDTVMFGLSDKGNHGLTSKVNISKNIYDDEIKDDVVLIDTNISVVDYPLQSVNTLRQYDYQGKKSFNQLDFQQAFKNKKVMYACVKLENGGLQEILVLMSKGKKKYYIAHYYNELIFMKIDGGSQKFPEKLLMNTNEWNMVGIQLTENETATVVEIILNGKVGTTFTINERLEIDEVTLGNQQHPDLPYLSRTSDTTSRIYELQRKMKVFSFSIGTNTHNINTIEKIYHAFKNCIQTNKEQTFDRTSYGTIIQETSYDELNRLVKKEINGLKTSFIYDKNKEGCATSRIALQNNPDKSYIRYNYDEMGNIIKKTTYSKDDYIEENNEYKYDMLGRLIEETITVGSLFKSKESIKYDSSGNILERINYNGQGIKIKEAKYQYDSIIKDRLSCITYTTYNTNGTVKNAEQTIFEYNGSYILNPSKIIKNGVSQNLTWLCSRLTTIGNEVYAYDESNIRESKKNHTYILEGTKIIFEEKKLANNQVIKMIYNYSEADELMGLTIGNNEYLYVKDITGNITKVIDNLGNTMVDYTYNAFGVPTKVLNGMLSSTKLTQAKEVYEHNSYMYKSYYYDFETGLYYLNSRYYDPQIGRFISADDISYLDFENINGLNLYSYCANNPIVYYDPLGNELVLIFGGLIVAYLVSAALVEYERQTHVLENALRMIGHSIYDGMVIAGNGIGDFVGYIIGNQDGLLDFESAVFTFDYTNQLDYYMFYKDHTSNKSPSKRNKHEKGQTTKKRDQGGEKGDKRRIDYRKNKKKLRVKFSSLLDIVNYYF